MPGVQNSQRTAKNNILSSAEKMAAYYIQRVKTALSYDIFFFGCRINKKKKGIESAFDSLPVLNEPRADLISNSFKVGMLGTSDYGSDGVVWGYLDHPSGFIAKWILAKFIRSFPGNPPHRASCPPKEVAQYQPYLDFLPYEKPMPITVKWESSMFLLWPLELCQALRTSSAVF